MDKLQTLSGCNSIEDFLLVLNSNADSIQLGKNFGLFDMVNIWKSVECGKVQSFKVSLFSKICLRGRSDLFSSYLRFIVCDVGNHEFVKNCAWYFCCVCKSCNVECFIELMKIYNMDSISGDILSSVMTSGVNDLGMLYCLYGFVSLDVWFCNKSVDVILMGESFEAVNYFICSYSEHDFDKYCDIVERVVERCFEIGSGCEENLIKIFIINYNILEKIINYLECVECSDECMCLCLKDVCGKFNSRHKGFVWWMRCFEVGDLNYDIII